MFLAYYTFIINDNIIMLSTLMTIIYMIMRHWIPENIYVATQCLAELRAMFPGSTSQMKKKARGEPGTFWHMTNIRLHQVDKTAQHIGIAIMERSIDAKSTTCTTRQIYAVETAADCTRQTVGGEQCKKYFV